MAIYRQLIKRLDSSLEQSEDISEDYSLTERHLHVLWLEQRYLHSLKTVAGVDIAVISPGIWNQGSGPDFLKAHLRIGSTDYRGDVEIHLHANEWYQHEHHLDVRYNRVILHLFYWKPVSLPSCINKENGQSAFNCYLEGFLTLPLPLLLSTIDFDFYPSKQFVSVGRCAPLVFQKISEGRTRSLFQSAAYWRLEKKLNYLEHYFPTNPPMQFMGGMAMALGYQHNAQAFLELFSYLFHYRDLPYDEVLAMALGCCGFLEEKRKESWMASSYYRYLCSLWGGLRSEVTHQANLKLDRIRPLNHPVRRLAYLVHLLQGVRFDAVWSKLLSLWEKDLHEQLDLKQFIKKFFEFIPVYSDLYWDYHFTFEQKSQSKRLSGLGKDVKLHILINTYLPLIYGRIKHLDSHAKTWELFQQLYASLHIPDTGKSRYLNYRFFGEEQKTSLFFEAQMAQGAYQLHQDFCTRFEASCEGCPFVERYYNSMSSPS